MNGIRCSEVVNQNAFFPYFINIQGINFLSNKFIGTFHESRVLAIIQSFSFFVFVEAVF